MTKRIDLYVGAPVSEGEVAEFIGYKVLPDDLQEAMRSLINRATADLEGEVGRLLLSRDLVQRVRSDGSIRHLVPEYPTTAVASMKYRDRLTQALTTMDISSIDFEANWIETPNATAPSGWTIEISGTFGYKRGFSSFHDAQIARAESIVLRLCQIKWQDREKKVGRALMAQTAQGQVTWSSTRLPDDLIRECYPLRRY